MTRKQYEKLRVGDKVKYIGKNDELLTTNKIYTIDSIGVLVYVKEIHLGGDFYQKFEYIPPNSVTFIKELQEDK